MTKPIGRGKELRPDLEINLKLRGLNDIQGKTFAKVTYQPHVLIVVKHKTEVLNQLQRLIEEVKNL